MERVSQSPCFKVSLSLLLMLLHKHCCFFLRHVLQRTLGTWNEHTGKYGWWKERTGTPSKSQLLKEHNTLLKTSFSPQWGIWIHRTEDTPYQVVLSLCEASQPRNDPVLMGKQERERSFQLSDATGSKADMSVALPQCPSSLPCAGGS